MLRTRRVCEWPYAVCEAVSCVWRRPRVSLVRRAEHDAVWRERGIAMSKTCASGA